MLTKQQIRTFLIQATCALYIVLFTYAATSKMLDFENFRAQLGQSPILSPFAEFVAYGVPILEFLLAALLLTKARVWALYLSTALMAMFAFYIFIILNYSTYVPCSCGGVLEKLGWAEHLVFNLAYVLLGSASLFSLSSNAKAAAFKIAGISMSSCLLVLVLFLTSEDLIQNDNPFIRRFPPHVADYRGQVDLKFNSYYIAGYSNNRLYLGNYSARLRLWSVGRTLRDRVEHLIHFDGEAPRFKRNVFKVVNGRFFILDGNVPAVYSGRTTDWKASISQGKPPYFTVAEPVDSATIAMRSINGMDRSNMLGTFSLDGNHVFYTNLLKPQAASDGIFETEGSLVYSKEIAGLVYMYRYRNEYFVFGLDGSLKYRSRTIDTMSRAHIKVVGLRDGKEKKMAAPPVVVNAETAIYKHLLFVRSTLRGKYDDKASWESAATIDVYDLRANKYLLSFYINDVDGTRMRGMAVTSRYIYALIGTKLVVYDIRNLLEKEIHRYDTNHS